AGPASAPGRPRRSRRAIASFVFALAGLLFLGLAYLVLCPGQGAAVLDGQVSGGLLALLCGLLAVPLGCLALGSLRHGGRVTNRHVVDASFDGRADAPDKLPDDKVQVLLVGGVAQPGRVVWVAPDGIDAAIVRVPCTTTKALAARWGESHRARIGDPVFAIGN